MMPLAPTLLILAAAYLLGSIPSGYLLVRIFRKQDIRSLGSGNIGATNVVRSGAKGLGAATFLLDLLKGVTAVQLGTILAAHFAPSLGSQNAAALCALFAVLGHIYPIWLGFKGGKGVATAFGVFLPLAPLAALVSFVLFLVLLAIFRYVSLGSIVSAAAFPLLALGFNRSLSRLTFYVAVAVALLVIVKHNQNIIRLISGTEHRWGSKKDQP